MQKNKANQCINLTAGAVRFLKFFARLSIDSWPANQTERIYQTFNGFRLIANIAGQGTTFFVKSAMISFMIPKIVSIFPDARFIHIYRNGPSVVESYVTMFCWATGAVLDVGSVPIAVQNSTCGINCGGNYTPAMLCWETVFSVLIAIWQNYSKRAVMAFFAFTGPVVVVKGKWDRQETAILS